MLKKGAVNRYK